MVRVKTVIFLAIGCLMIASGFVVWAIAQHKKSFAWDRLLLTSPSFSNGTILPSEFTCDGTNVNPVISIQNIPDGTESVVVDMIDTSGLGNHADWVLWNASPLINKIPKNAPPDVGVIGVNDFGKNEYDGPCPEKGARHYKYEAYALNTILDLPASANYSELQQAIDKHVLAYGSISVVYTKQNNIEVDTNSIGQ